MSAPLGSYAFLPWLRRGLATEITRVDDGSPSADGHVPLPVAITLNTDRTATAPLALFGPGEVGGLDPQAVVRVYPTRNQYDAEPNYFPLVELDQCDLPWRYTPAAATAGDRLRPWLTLATLREDEITAFDEPGADGRPAAVTVADATALPHPTQTWAWAHVQVAGAGATPPDAATLPQLLKVAPERVHARLLCPRRLEPHTHYLACLVPTFEIGRLAGLRLPVVGDALAAAWTSESTGVRLPVYYWWRFGTGAGVDFEFLARQLEARPIPPGVGTRPMDVDAPGSGLPPAADAPLPLEGALVPPGYERAPWSGPVPDTFRSRLAALLNRPADIAATGQGTRVVAPPLYGRWHARRERLDPAAPPPWFAALNADPRDRVPAGLGTRVVQAMQRQLMAGAWAQVRGIREANERLRLTQLARAMAGRVFLRHLVPASDTEMLVVAAPVHAKVRTGPGTVSTRMGTSTVPGGLLDAAFRRVSRPRGPIGRRLGYADRPQRATEILDRVNRGDIQIAPTPTRPDGILSPGTSGPPVLPDWATPVSMTFLRLLARWFPLIALVLLALAVIALISGAVVVAVLLAAAALVTVGAGLLARRMVRRLDRLLAFGSGTLTGDAVRSAPPQPGFVPQVGVHLDSDPPSAPTTPEPQVDGEARSAHTFREAAAALFDQVNTPAERPPDRTAVSIPALRDDLGTALRPDVTVPAGVAERLRLPVDVTRQPSADPIEPVLAAPDFPQPMYAPLAALSQDWLLPGLDAVPPNTTTVLQTNQRFVESYLIGLNHEMARELQWNEYPTDLRGTYFRQFWDVSGSVALATGAVDRESLRDIRPLHEWGPDATLGANRPQRPAAGEHLVLLVRGELLRRYPNTIVYAVPALAGQGGRTLGATERHPLFTGRLEPDVAFFGFDLTADEARGNPDPNADQGYFFVLQEQPAEPRFGLDIAGPALGGAPTAWSDLSWGSLAATEPELAAITHIDLDAALPDTRFVAVTGGAEWHADAGTGATGTRSSQLAYITLQQPVRVAIHGSDMIR